MGSNPTSSAMFPGRLMVGHLILAQAMEVRVLPGEPVFGWVAEWLKALAC